MDPSEANLYIKPTLFLWSGSFLVVFLWVTEVWRHVWASRAGAAGPSGAASPGGSVGPIGAVGPCWRWISVNLEYLLYIGFDYDLQLTRH
jgi:hypothetical protein